MQKVRGFLLCALLCCFFELVGQPFPPPPEQSLQNQTFTYAEGIRFLERLAAASPYLHLREVGSTDAGKPLHTAIFSARKVFEPDTLTENTTVWLINNAIHPGEPDGVDASFQLLYDLCQDEALRKQSEGITLVVIPFYNVGGALNRRHYTRVNQQGPHEMGFRGNAQNYDLNRDFMKADTRNARTFFQIFHHWDPDFFVDTHVSNGADYSYTFTQLNTLPQKLSPPLSTYFGQVFSPELVRQMENHYQEPVTPYVNAWRNPPDSGFAHFLDLPRYSSGYAALFHTPAVVPEMHMLKPYPRRVEAMYRFLRSCLDVLAKEGATLRQKRAKARRNEQKNPDFSFGWQLDPTQADTITFAGYTAFYAQSPVTGQQQLYYDRKRPYQKAIPFYSTYQTTRKRPKPAAFWLPPSAYRTLELLALQGIEMDTLQQDTSLLLESYYITDFQTRNAPYEGHYQHYDTEIEIRRDSLRLRAGSVRISTDQKGVRYIMEALWPEAEDSFFNWNFFDAILQQKEGISTYVFDGLAEKLLIDDPELRQKLEAKREEDPEFAQSARAQLQFIYQHSPYFEPEYRRYPVFGEP